MATKAELLEEISGLKSVRQDLRSDLVMRDNTIVRLGDDLKRCEDVLVEKDNVLKCVGEQLKRLQDDLWDHLNVFHPDYVDEDSAESRSLRAIRSRPTYS